MKEIAVATGARVARGDAEALVAGVATDSRDVASGTLFVALRGERSDGHEHAAEAVAAGAVAVLATKDIVVDAAVLLVDDPVRALGTLAAAVRDRLACSVVAITGSAGKTSTREMTASALSTRFRTAAAVRNHNNEIGVPLTILAADADTEALVVEVGARGEGHIASLMPVVRPDVGIVTNVGAAHVGMFGSADATERAKGELVEALPSEGTAVLNADDERVARMARRTRARVLTFGFGPDADVRGRDLTVGENGGARFTVSHRDDAVDVALKVPGEHMAPNALAAIAAALACGVSLADAAAGVARCTGAPMRMEVADANGRLVVNDAYNASPESMAAALKAIVALAHGRPTWAVVGAMAELGARATEEHDRIGRLAVRLGIGHLVVVGDGARATFEAARLEGMPPDEVTFVEEAAGAVEAVRAQWEHDAVVLVKASRAARLERVVEGLLA